MPACTKCLAYSPYTHECLISVGSPLRKCVIQLLNLLIDEISPNSKVLEIGCGSWNFFKNLAEKKNCEYFCIEPRAYNENNKPTYATKIGTVDQIPYPKGTFDYVIGNQTMEHWNEYNTTFTVGLGEINRVLKPNGWLFLNVPIHLHGDSLFLNGDEKGINDLFNRKIWDSVLFEKWRYDFYPLDPYEGWKLNSVEESGFIQNDQIIRSSWILEIKAKKKAIGKISSNFNLLNKFF